jgi:DNA-binding GntR family transcriptional regulator
MSSPPPASPLTVPELPAASASPIAAANRDGRLRLRGAEDAPGLYTAHEVVLQALRRALLTGGIPAGTRLVQDDIAAQLGVSNTPVREAIRQLAAEGLVRFVRYKGAVVHKPTLAEIQELYELRLLLEPVAIGKAAERMSDAEIEQARRFFRRAVATTALEDWIVRNREFHGCLIEGAHSPRLSTFVASLKDLALTQVWVSISSASDRMAMVAGGNAEHAEILEAVESRDSARAAQVVRGHLEAAAKAVEQYMEHEGAGVAERATE